MEVEKWDQVNGNKESTYLLISSKIDRGDGD